MIISSIIALVLASTPAFSQQIVYNQFHNASPITGTWSTGSQAVQTGPGFANPINQSFTYPPTTGVSYSFTDTYYEISRYRFVSNGSQPTCIVGVVVWCHGTYTLNPNGSITMTPFGDGFQQVQDPCGAVSNFVQPYNDTEYYQSWQIFQDPVTGYKLHLFQWDGTPVAPQFQVSSTPNMLPTQLLRNVTPSSVGASPTGGFTAQGDIALSGNARRKWSSIPGVLVASVAIGLGVLSLVV